MTGAPGGPPASGAALAGKAAILTSTVLWGTLWIPMRQMELAEFTAVPAPAFGFLLGLAVLLPFGLLKLRRILDGGWPVVLAGLLTALSITLYAEGLVRGQVARVILLFYLTPVWSTLLARWALGEVITRSRIVTIVLGLSGMLVIFGVDAGVPVPRSAGDWMGLASGIVWAFAVLYVGKTAARPLLDRIFVQFIFLAPCFFLLTLLPGARADAGAPLDLLAGSSLWLAAFAVLWILPLVWLTYFGASRLEPGQVAIFLMFEIVIGLSSAALLTDEPFGIRELLGAGLIGAASLAEFMGGRPDRRLSGAAIGSSSSK